jgi:hypothetical protein
MDSDNDDSIGVEKWSAADDAALAAFVRREHADRLGKSTGDPEYLMEYMHSGWVVLFDEGTQNEGAYTFEDGKKASSYLIVFEDKQDADRYVFQLRQEMAWHGSMAAVMWPRRRIFEFCKAAHLHSSFEILLVRRGWNMTPPKNNKVEAGLLKSKLAEPDQSRWTAADDAAFWKHIRDQGQY